MNVKQKLQQLMQAVRQALRQPGLDSPSAAKRLVLRFFRVLVLVWRGFTEDDLLIHASALTYATLMSLVPLLAIAFSVLRGLGAGQEQLNKLLEWKQRMPQEFQSFIDQIVTVVSHTNFAALGWIGLAALILIAVMVLGSMETSFNRIWAVKRARNPLRRIANYISILVVVPILIGMASTVAASLRSPAVVERLGIAAGIYGYLLRLTPLIGTWAAFVFLYTMIPNTRVSFSAAGLSGLITALLWLGWQKLYVSMQVGVARYNAIYGTFATIPIFLAWLYTGWVIVLLGAEISFAIQHHATYPLELVQASPRTFSLLTTMVAAEAAANLKDGRPFLPGEFAARHRVPVRLVNAAVSFLVSRRWMAELAETRGGFVFSRDPDQCYVGDLIREVFRDGADTSDLGIQGVPEEMQKLVQQVEQGMIQPASGLTLEELAAALNRTPNAGITGQARA